MSNNLDARTQAWIDAQNAVLGSILIDSRCLPVVLKHVGPEDFSPGYHSLLFRTAVMLFSTNQAIDPVLILNNIPEDAVADRSDLRRFAMDLMQITPTAANAEHYATIVRQHGVLARIHEAADELLRTTDVSEARQIINRVSAASMAQRNTGTTTMAEGLVGFFDRLDDGREWLKWPFRNFGKHLFVRLGDFVVLGAESSVGKTALALQLATFWAFHGKRVGFYSLETDDEDVMDRLMAGFLGTDMKQILLGHLTDQDLTNAAYITAKASALPFDIKGAAGMTASDITTDALIHQYDIILVDYLQLVEPEGGATREQEIGKISRKFKSFGRSAKVTVVALSQLNRDVTAEHPTVDRLRDSSQIRNDADLILLMSLEKQENNEKTPKRRLQIGKNKRGPLTYAVLKFDGPRQLFYDTADSGPKPLFPLPKVEQMTLTRENDI